MMEPWLRAAIAAADLVNEAPDEYTLASLADALRQMADRIEASIPPAPKPEPRTHLRLVANED
jgi:hypothetical protein